MHSSQVKGLLIAIAVLLVACICCFGSARGYYEIGRIGSVAAARRVGVEPGYENIAEYIKESIEPGMSRDEVEKVLSTIAPLKIKHGTLHETAAYESPIACDQIDVQITPLPGHTWPIIACYNANGELLNMKSSGFDWPTLDIYSSAYEE